MTDQSSFTPPVDLAEICLDNLLEATDSHLYFKDRRSRFYRVSRGVVEAAGRARARRGMVVTTEADLVGKTDFDLFQDPQAQVMFDEEARIISSGQPGREVIERQTWSDRPPTYVLTRKLPLRDRDDRIVGTFGFSRDVTDEVVNRRQLEAILAMSPDAICRFDDQLRYVYVNPAAERWLGTPARNIVGKRADEVSADQVIDLAQAALRRVLESGEPSQVELEFLRDRNPFYLDARLIPERDNGLTTGVLVLARDVTARKRAELELAEQAVRDPLTGLANRALLLDRLDQSLIRLDRLPGTVAVMFIDLDRFKAINDNLGHAVGDALLKEVATRLSACARRSDTLARFGGDEFVLLCDRLLSADDARTIAERIIRELAEPFSYEGHVLRLSGSVGIAATSSSATGSAELIRDADSAMYQAKERGRGSGRFLFFDGETRTRVVSRIELEGQLQDALQKDEFRLYYQPLQDLSTGTLHGVEALLRWEHPARGLLLPADFMPVAEKSGLIVPIGRWVLREACRQLASWSARFPSNPPLRMAVNVSAKQIGPDLVPVVASALQEYGIGPHRLCLEITETAMLEEAAASLEVFAALHELGVLLALDDFGTGYSSLGHLRRFPVDILKIDREFVAGLTQGAGDNAIVNAITAMAHALGMTTVGEGVEQAGQLQRLTEAGCDSGQGYLLGRPMPAADLTALL